MGIAGRFRRSTDGSDNMKPTDTHHELPTQEDVNSFLDWLRMTGKTNMFGAVPYIQENFGITKYDANRFLVKWMETFGERDSQ